MFDREFEEEALPKKGFRCTLRLSPEAYRKLREMETSLVLLHGLRPEQVTRSKIVSLALETIELEALLHRFLENPAP